MGAFSKFPELQGVMFLSSQQVRVGGRGRGADADVAHSVLPGTSTLRAAMPSKTVVLSALATP